MHQFRLSGICIFAPLLALFSGCSAGHVDWANEGAPANTGFFTKQFNFESQTRNYTV